MATYRHSGWEQYDGLEFYSIEKKVWWGWKEMTWWHKNEVGRKLMNRAIKGLIKNGHTVL